MQDLRQSGFKKDRKGTYCLWQLLGFYNEGKALLTLYSRIISVLCYITVLRTFLLAASAQVEIELKQKSKEERKKQHAINTHPTHTPKSDDSYRASSKSHVSH